MPTPVPTELIEQLKAAGYRRLTFSPMRTLNFAVAPMGVVVLGTICLMIFLGMLMPRMETYRIEAFNFKGINPPIYQTHHQPFGIGNSTYFLCNGRFIGVSGDGVSIAINSQDKAQGEVFDCR